MSVIDDAKRVINGYYLGQFEKLYIPEDVIRDVFEVALDSAKEVKHFCLFSDTIEEDKLYNCVDIATHSCPEKIVQQCIAVNNIKQLENRVQFPFLDLSSNAKQGIILLSNVSVELLPTPFNFLLFDSKFALVLDSDQDGGYYLASNDSLISECNSWLSVKMIKRNELNTCFLQEPLMMSADMVSEVASVMCTHDHMNMEGCYWYHSVWQYLRLMNMVSTPSWHHDFYIEQICKAVESVEKPQVLISGAADYSSLSYVIRAFETVGKTGAYDVLDLCETPLFSCKWYAKRKNAHLGILQMSIFDLKIEGKYDLICTDAFLTRFPKEQMENILNIWYKSLKAEGQIVTTIRIHDDKHMCPDTPSEDDVSIFAEKARRRSKLWGPVINYSSDEIANKAKVYAEKMHSNCVGTRDDIEKAFVNSGFVIDYIEDIDVVGELYPSRYLRIRAKKLGG